MLRVLHIVSIMDAGGAETFLMKVFRNIDRTRIMFDFFVVSPEKGYYDEEILSLGGKIFRGRPKSTNPLLSFVDVWKTVKKNNYKAVLRTSSHSLACLDLLAAAIGGAKIRVMRSTNAGFDGNTFSFLLHLLFRPMLNSIVTLKIAPSTEAAVWLFGKKTVSDGDVKIINNGIEVDKYIFSSIKRKGIRAELGIQNKFVVGHIGRFTGQKNHEYLIDIFIIIKKTYDNSVLLLIGKGELEAKIREKVINSGLEESIFFLGVRSDIPRLLMAMDVLVFPSLYEGMPNSVIEAQGTGLRCVVSDEVTKDVKITDLVEFMPLRCEPEEWADKALQYNSGYERLIMKEKFCENGYDIQVTAKWLTQYFDTQLIGSDTNGK